MQIRQVEMRQVSTCVFAQVLFDEKGFSIDLFIYYFFVEPKWYFTSKRHMKLPCQTYKVAQYHIGLL